MKLWITVSIGLLIHASALCQGIEFAELPWKDALAKASAENRLIFVDAYTTWCGPCKMMDRNVFPLPQVGDFFNRHFINLKMDMEKGEGPALAKVYQVNAYPSFLFIDGQGQLVHKGVGYCEADDFIALARQAQDSDHNLLAMRRRYEAGERNPQFLYDYANKLYDIHDSAFVSVTIEYLNGQKDWNTPTNLDLIYKTSDATDSPMFDYLIQNKDLFIEHLGSRAVLGKIDGLTTNAIYTAHLTGNYDPLLELFEKMYPGKGLQMVEQVQMNYYAESENYSAYAKAAIEYYDRYPAESWEELNEAAWLFTTLVDDPAQLKHALKWVRQSIRMDSNYYNHDTLALLLYKLGKRKKAIKAAKKAIDIARRTGEDYSSTENWLEDIRRK